MKQIWVLTELYFPEETSTSYFLTKIAECLAEEYAVDVITGPATLNLQHVSYPNFQEVNKVKIFRCSGTSFNKNKLLGRLVNGVTRSLSIFWKAVRLCKSNNIVLVVTNPPLLPFVALAIKCLKGCNFVLLVHDVYPEALVATGLIKKKSIIHQCFQIANSILYQQAIRVITLGRDMSQLVKRKIQSEQHNKIICIPNWADTEFVHPTARQCNSLLDELGISDCFVILYAGNMGRTHGIESIAEAARVLNMLNSSIRFLFIGTGAKKTWLCEFVAQHNLQNTMILPFRPSAEKIISLNACDLAVISFLSGMAGVSVPSRMYNQMAAGKPIIAIADPESELAQVIREEEIGWVIQPEDTHALIHMIKVAAENIDACQAMGTKSVAVVNEKYTFPHIQKAYHELFSSLFLMQP